MIDGYLAKWRTRRLADVTTDDVARLHDRLGKGNGRYDANRTVALLRTMFNLARDWGYLSAANPATRIKFYREEKRDRFVSPGTRLLDQGFVHSTQLFRLGAGNTTSSTVGKEPKHGCSGLGY